MFVLRSGCKLPQIANICFHMTRLISPSNRISRWLLQSWCRHHGRSAEKVTAVSKYTLTQIHKLENWKNTKIFRSLGGWPKWSSYFHSSQSHSALQCHKRPWWITAMVSLDIKASWAWDWAAWHNLCTLLWIYPCLCIYSHLWLWRIVRKKSLRASQVSRNQFAIFPRNVFANSQRYTPIPW